MKRKLTVICIAAVTAICSIGIVLCIAVTFFSYFASAISFVQSIQYSGQDYTESTLALSDMVLSYQNRVMEEAEKYGKEEYVKLFLAVMMQESGGNGTDVYQCSESLGKTRNSLSTEESIVQGIKLLAGYIDSAGVTGTGDILGMRLVLQTYNFGSGYMSWAKARDGCWTQENVNAYAEKYSKGVRRTGVRAERMGVWNYGDQFYTDHVLRYYAYTDSTDSGIGNSNSNRIIEEAQKHLGKQYKYGATGPDKFDCSGFVFYVYRVTGYYTGARNTAAGYKNIAAPLSEEEARAGDLVFFTNRSGKTHHVGIYLGEGKMIHAPSTGDVVKISTIYRTNGDTVSFGRLY